MPKRVYLPPQFNAQSVRNVIQEVIDDQKQPLCDQVIFDFQNLHFIDTDGVTVLANMLEWLFRCQVPVYFEGHNSVSDPIRYLDDFGFFEKYLGERLNKFSSPRSTTIPFRRVDCAESHFWLENIVFPWIANIANLTESSLYDFRVCIKELFNNIQDHSTETGGYSHIQWHPNRNIVSISVSDLGVGIPTEIAKAYTVTDDGHALALAVQEGVSSKRAEGKNTGAGLAYLVQNVVARNDGWVRIYSNRGDLVCQRSPTGVVRNPSVSRGFYPGTLFNIALRTDRIERIEDVREDLEW